MAITGQFLGSLKKRFIFFGSSMGLVFWMIPLLNNKDIVHGRNPAVVME
jgi:hypothetical protein